MSHLLLTLQAQPNELARRLTCLVQEQPEMINTLKFLHFEEDEYLVKLLVEHPKSIDELKVIFSQSVSNDWATSSIGLRDLLDYEVWDDFTKKRKLDKVISTLEEQGLEQLTTEMIQCGLVNPFKHHSVVDEENESEMIDMLIQSLT